jgi:hypothetical protein
LFAFIPSILPLLLARIHSTVACSHSFHCCLFAFIPSILPISPAVYLFILCCIGFLQYGFRDLVVF